MRSRYIFICKNSKELKCFLYIFFYNQSTDDRELSDETLQFCKNLVTEKFRTQLMNETDLERDILFKLHHVIMREIAANLIVRQKLKEINELELTQLIYQVLRESYGFM